MTFRDIWIYAVDWLSITFEPAIFYSTGRIDQVEEENTSYRYNARPTTGFRNQENNYRVYPKAQDPDTISQTSFGRINERDYGRVQDSQENERLLFQVNWIIVFVGVLIGQDF